MNKDKLQKIIAITAAIFTAGAFIPKAFKIFSTKDATSIHTTTVFLFLIGQLLWLIDSNLTKDIGLAASSTLNTFIYIFFIYA